MAQNLTLYIKDGNRYKEYGVGFNRSYLSNGIWYVSGGGNRITGLNYIKGLVKIADNPEVDSLKETIQRFELGEEILESQEFLNWCKQKNYQYSISEIVHFVVNYLVNMNKNSNKYE